MPNLENTEKLLMNQVRAVRQGELNNEYENWDKVNNGDMLNFDWSKNLYELQISRLKQWAMSQVTTCITFIFPFNQFS